MCLYPVTCKQLDAFGCTRVQTFPCGKCLECLKDRQNSWKLRLVEEASNWSQLFFFTLTYSEESVPRNEKGNTTAFKKHLQDWIKRFRASYKREFGYDAKFMYFICAEYAPDGYYVDRHGVRRRSTCRPHYHGVIFSDIAVATICKLFSEWTTLYGFCNWKRVGASRAEYSAVANYVSKYCCKGEFASRQDEIARGEIQPAFSIMSKGIGSSYVERMRSFHLDGLKSNYFAVPADRLDRIISRMKVRDGEFLYKMPRFYKDRIYRYVDYKLKETWDEKSKSFVTTKIDKRTGEVKPNLVKRFTSKNPLQVQITNELQRRFFEKHRDTEDYWIPKLLDGSALGLDPLGTGPASVSAKANRLRAQFKSFYDANAFKNSNLNFFN